MQCSNCGADLALDDLFCGQCGTPRSKLSPVFEAIVARFAALKARYDAGEVSESEYDAELRKLIIQDEAGRYWMIGPETGRWYRYDGNDWIPADPVKLASAESASLAVSSAAPVAPAATVGQVPEALPRARRGTSRLRLAAAGMLALALLGAAFLWVSRDLLDDWMDDVREISRPAAPLPPTRTPTRLVRPTDTARPRPSATATEEMAYAFEDEFDDASAGWSLGESDDYRRWVESSEYHILVKQSQWAIWSTRWPSENTYGDFVYTVFARWVDDVPGACALIFRYQDNDHFYYFHASSNGYFKIGKRMGGEWTDIVGWTYSYVVDPLENALQVMCDGNTITVFANDELLASVTDQSFAEGDIGLMAESFDEPGAHVAFDRVSVISFD